MSTVKVYQHLKWLEHHTYIFIDGKRLPISFQGGVLAPKKVRGTYVTASPSIQQAMDNDPRNGMLWRCIKGDGPVKKTKKTQHTVGKQTELQDVAGVNTIQEAKEFLLANVEGLDGAALTNKRVVLETATLAGYRFPQIK